MGGGELGVLDGVGGVVVAPEGLDLGIEAGVVGTGDGVVALEEVLEVGDVGAGDIGDVMDFSSSDLSEIAPSDVFV